ncbi:MAG: ABC transporter substrate-binding protein [Acidimicrobiia bacterium]|nr:ABC transporter substrate-binding protein [Acidimicrobiia bacterium]
MRSRRILAILAVLAMVVAACNGADPTTTTSEPPPPTTTQPPGPTTTGMMDELVYDVGFDPDTGTIKLGALAALTGPIPGIGASLLNGHRVYWESVNADGGVAGMYPVEVVVRDNAYNPETNVVVYNEIKDEVLAFSSAIGTPTTASIYEDAAGENILVAAGSLASQWALTDNVLLNLGANTYFAQFANAPYWAMNVADPAIITDESVVGIIYQGDDYGQDCKNGYDFGQANTGFNHQYEATYAATDTEFSAQIGGAQAAGVSVLFICALPTALATMLGTAAALEYSPTVFGSSPSYNPVLPSALGGGDEAAGLAVFASFPYYGLGAGPEFEDDTPGMAELRADLEAHRDAIGVTDEMINAFYYFGYTQAQTFHILLEAAVANGDISRAGLLAAINLVQDVDLGYGGAAGGYGATPLERIPTNEDNIGVPVSVTENVFGLMDITGFFEAPYMADWDPAG